MKALRVLLTSILVVIVIGCAKERPAEAPASATTATTSPSAPATESAAATPAETTTGEAEPSATSTVAATTTPPESVAAATETKPAKPDPKLVATGKDLFRSKCASCHGEQGKGDTQIGRTRNLRDLASADVQSQSDEKLAEILRGGSGSLSAKAHESRALTTEQIDALIAFIRSLG